MKPTVSGIIVKAVSVMLLWPVLPAASAPPVPDKDFEKRRQEALLGFESPLARDFAPIEAYLREVDYAHAMPRFQKLLSKYPDCLWLQFQQAIYMGQMGLLPRAKAVMEQVIKKAESKGERYYSWYLSYAELLGLLHARQEQIAVFEKMEKLFPGSRSEIAGILAQLYRRVGDNAKAEAAVSQSRQQKGAPPEALLLDIKPVNVEPFAPGTGLELIARSEYFQRFKYNLDGVYGMGETGASQYVSMPPNYDKITVAARESGTRYVMPVQKFFKDFQKVRARQPRYTRVTLVGTKMVGPIKTEQYLCQCQDESRYDLILLGRTVPIATELARVQAQMNDVPFTNCFVVGYSRVEGGYARPVLHFFSLKKSKFDRNECKKVNTYRPVKSLDELIFAESDGFTMDHFK